MNTPQIIRSNIMELLFQINDVQALETIYQQMTETVEKKVYTKSTNDDIPAIAKEPIPDYIPFEQILAEQGGFSMKNFNETVEKIDFTIFKDESLEDMLNTLTK